MKLSLYVVSDSLGETGEQVVKACLSQFHVEEYEINRFSYVLNIEVLHEILTKASQEEKSILIYTLVNPEFIQYVKNYTKDSKLITVDLLSPLLDSIEKVSGVSPIGEPGIIRRLDQAYFSRVEAIEFAVKYDDGKDPRGVLKADVVIIGISRTSKTPLSMYLANKNLKVANIPLVPESIPPRELDKVSKKRIIGLTNSPIKLTEIREERLRSLGLPKGSSYSSMQRVLDEIEYAERIMKKIGCPIIDVSNKAIEETADIIISHLKKSGVKILPD